MKNAIKRLILFDIDGTLIDPGGSGRTALNRTVIEMFSIENAFDGMRLAGKTDIQIVKEGLSHHGLSITEEILTSVISTYLRHLEKTVENPEKHLHPGVMELLDALTAKEGYGIGLLSGNIEQGARLKLEPFGLNRYFPFGAFGDDSEDRNRLLPIAVEKFRINSGISVPFSNCMVIGDTPSDVNCAKPYGAETIAVATGPYDHETLLKTGADHVLNDLTEAQKLIIN